MPTHVRPPRQLSSLPARGAWIEITFALNNAITTESLPARGAWIEIERITAPSPSVKVAPRTGSVD